MVSSILFIRIIFTVILCLLGLFLPRNKILFLIQASWMLILTCFNTDAGDWDGNEAIYNASSIKSSNISNFFYNFIVNISKSLGWNFTIFNGVVSFIVTIIIVFIIYKLTQNISLVMSFWMIYPLFDNIIQKRAYLGLGIVILAVYILLKQRQSKISYIIFEVLVILAYQIHTMYFLYLTLPFFLLLSKRRQKIFIIFCILFGFVFRSKLGTVVNNTLGSSAESKTELYFQTLTSSTSFSVSLMWMLWQLLECCIMYYLLNESKDFRSSCILSINYWCLLLIPFYSFGAVFTRIARVILLFNYISVADNYEINNFIIKKKVLLVLVLQVFFILISFWMFDLHTALGANILIYPIFESNSFFNW